MNLYRDREEIFASILHATGLDGARLTRIMYSTYLSYGKVVEYLALLVENNFLNYDQAEKKFNVTPKGVRYLVVREKLCEILDLRANSQKIEPKT